MYRHTRHLRYIIFLFWLFACHTLLQGQEERDRSIETIIQGGHISPIGGYDISRDGKYLVSWEISSRAIVWDMRSGRRLGDVTYPDALQSIKETIFHPYDSRLVYIRSLHPTSTKKAIPWLVMDWRTNTQVGIIYSDEVPGRLLQYKGLAMEVLRDCTIEAYDRSTHLRVMRYGGILPMLYRASTDVTDSLLLVVENNPQIWDLKRLELTARIPYKERLLQDTAMVYINDRIVPIKKDMRMVNTYRQQLRSQSFSQIETARQLNQQLIKGTDSNIELAKSILEQMDAEEQEIPLIKADTDVSARSLQIRNRPASRVQKRDSVYERDREYLELPFNSGDDYLKYGYKNYFEGNFTNEGILMGGFGREVTLWNSKGELLTSRLSEGYPVFAVGRAGSQWVAATYNGLQVGSVKGNKSLSPIKNAKSPVSQLINTLEVLPDGRSFVFGCDGGQVYLSSVDDLSKMKRLSADAMPVMSVCSDREGNRVLSASEGGIFRMYDLRTGEQVQYTDPFRAARMSCCAFINDSVIAAGGNDGYIALWHVNEKNSFRQIRCHDAEVTSIALSRDGRLVFTTSRDGTTKIYHADDFTEIVRLMAIDNTMDYIAVTPDHYYKASAGSVEGVHFLKGYETYAYDQFDLRFNRPDIVLQRLGLASEQTIELHHRAWQKRLRRAGVREETLSPDFHIPSIQILNRNQIPTYVSDTLLTLKLRLQDEKYSVTRLQTWINGVPLGGTSGGHTHVKAGEVVDLEVRVPLLEGNNRIDVSCMNELGAESYKQSVYVFCQTPLAPPDLYLLCVGVSEYADDRYDLEYARKDARDMATIFRRFNEEEKNYDQLHTHILTDKEVTRDSFAAWRQVLSQARPQDVVILFYAGHGIVDANLDYYLATHDTDFDLPQERALIYEEFEGLLDDIAPLRKLVLIDACHSGEIDKTEPWKKIASNISLPDRGKVIFRGVGAAEHSPVRTEEINEVVGTLFTDLRRGIGATILSSAGATETAVEGHQWRNGLFTYVVKEALLDRKADLNGDGRITTTELKIYTGRRVSELSGGWQQPTSRLENRQMEFDLTGWLLK